MAYFSSYGNLIKREIRLFQWAILQNKHIPLGFLCYDVLSKFLLVWQMKNTARFFWTEIYAIFLSYMSNKDDDKMKQKELSMPISYKGGDS